MKSEGETKKKKAGAVELRVGRKEEETPALYKSPSAKLQGRPANHWCIAERI